MPMMQLYISGAQQTSPNNPLPTNPQTPNTPNNPLPNANDSKNNSNGNRRIALAVAIQMGSQALSYVGNNVGKYTGDSRNQERLDNISQGISIASTFAINGWLGVANLAMQGITSFIDYKYDRWKSQVETNYQKTMQGYAYGESIFSSRRH